MQRIYKTWFSAAHAIKDHPKCGRTHGHNYKLVVKVNAPSTEWMDFALIKLATEEVLEQDYDHRDLGYVTAEELAEEICKKIKRSLKPPLINTKPLTVNVELWETEHFGVATDY